MRPSPEIGYRSRLRFGTFAAGLLRAAAVGVVSSLACVGLRLLFAGLQWVFTQRLGLLADVAASLPPAKRAFVPVAGGLCAWFIVWVAARRGGSEPARDYVEAVRFHGGKIPFAATAWRAFSSAFSVASGAAIGREGSMIQFASSVISGTARWTGVRGLPLAQQVACGVAAAVATVYRAPVAGVFFASEIVLGALTWREAPTLVVASVVGYATNRLVVGGGALFPVRGSLPVVSSDWICAFVLAALCGVAGPFYQKLMRWFKPASKLPVALAWGGLLVGLLSLAEPMVWGNGDSALTAILGDSPTVQMVAGLLIIRLLATSFCAGVGTVGGVFTPTLFAGVAIGFAVAHVFPVEHPALLAVAGLGALLSAVTHAPLMATFMTVELTGQWRVLPAILIGNLLSHQVACLFSSRSLYAVATPMPLNEGVPVKRGKVPTHDLNQEGQ